MLALVEFVRSNTRTASAVFTPVHTGDTINHSVVDQVRLRDVGCRLTGVKRTPVNLAPAQLAQQIQERPVMVSKLEVVHGLPYQMGETTFGLVQVLTGIEFPADDWKPDVPQNAFLAQPAVHVIFGAFRIWLDFTPDGIFIRARDGQGTPLLELTSVINDRRQCCDLPNEFIDQPIRPIYDSNVPDLDAKFFIVHKFVGDIVWLSGEAEPESDDEEDDDDDEMVVSDANIVDLDEKLRSTTMEFVRRQRDGMFGSAMELVHRDEVWLDTGG
ncbi:hypothetical protein DFH09DRAFT_1131272 [Mycena vulgaris]|nr:hypothetical protein DFH09DRAFT_1131272 [Mycena vulgaris]